MKWDIIVESDGREIYVKDYHLTPISDSIPFNKYLQENLLNYSHQYNIQKLYENIQGNFYDNCTKSECSHAWPVVKSNDVEDTYDDTLMMGCQRAHYDIYNKQFEFLCPMWLEDMDNKSLQFELNLYADQQKTRRLLSKRLKLKKLDNQYKYHNKFIEYFNKYLDDIYLTNKSSIITGSDNININFKTQKARIVGLNVKSGNVDGLDINNLPVNLMYRERPMMEFDNMIIDSYKENNLIARQLFNFNICFNVEDFINVNFERDMVGYPIVIELKTYIEDLSSNSIDNVAECELKDFFFNYDYISRHNISIENDLFKNIAINDIPSRFDKEIERVNVFNYLQDNKCVDFVNVNKFSPNIIHWSLEENNDYIFNLYNGYGAYIVDNDIIKEINKRFDNQPNISNRDYNEILYNIGWVNVFSDNLTYKMITDLSQKFDADKYNPKFSYLYNGMNYLNNVKYEQPFKSNELNHCHLAIAKTNPNVYNYICTQQSTLFEAVEIYKNNSDDDRKFAIVAIDVQITHIDYTATDEYYYLIIAPNFNNLTYKNVVDYLININPDLKTQIQENYQLIPYLIDSPVSFFSSAVEPNVISFTKGVFIHKTDSPSEQTNEIDYYKDDSMYITYLQRYDGRIRPTFIDPISPKTIVDPYSLKFNQKFNYMFAKKQFDVAEIKIDSENNDAQAYSKYSSSGFEPQFPSINYWAIRKLYLNYIPYIEENTKTGKILAEKSFPVENSQLNQLNKCHKWFNSNVQISLLPQIDLDIKDNPDEPNIPTHTTESVEQQIKSKLFVEPDGIYTNVSEDLKDYIWNCYTYKNDFDYLTDKDIIHYKYNITLKLK